MDTMVGARQQHVKRELTGAIVNIKFQIVANIPFTSWPVSKKPYFFENVITPMTSNEKYCSQSARSKVLWGSI